MFDKLIKNINPFDVIVILSLLFLMCTRAMSQAESHGLSGNNTDVQKGYYGSSNVRFNLGQLFAEPADIQLEHDGESRIFFGSRSRSQDTVTKHPYIVSLLIKVARNQNTYRVCSGSLMSAGWVMSSARCLGGCGRCAPALYMCAGLSVVQTNYAQRPEGAQCRKAANVYVHPKYRTKSTNGDYDVAIVKANTLFNLKTKFVQVIKLSIQNFIQKKIKKCDLTGFVKGQKESDYDINVENVEVKKPCNDDFQFSSLLDEADNAQNEQGDAQNEEQEQDLKKESGLDRYMCTAPQKGPGSGLRSEMTGGGLVCAGQLTAIASSMMQYTGNSNKPVVPFTCAAKCDDVPKMTVFQDICPHLRWINSLVQLFDSNDIPLECRGTAAHRYCGTTQLMFSFVTGLILIFFR